MPFDLDLDLDLDCDLLTLTFGAVVVVGRVVLDSVDRDGAGVAGSAGHVPAAAVRGRPAGRAGEQTPHVAALLLPAIPLLLPRWCRQGQPLLMHNSAIFIIDCSYKIHSCSSIVHRLFIHVHRLFIDCSFMFNNYSYKIHSSSSVVHSCSSIVHRLFIDCSFMFNDYSYKIHSSSSVVHSCSSIVHRLFIHVQ